MNSLVISPYGFNLPYIISLVVDCSTILIKQDFTGKLKIPINNFISCTFHGTYKPITVLTAAIH